MQYPPQWIPSPLRWQNYPEALTYVPFGQFALNTLFIAAFAILWKSFVLHHHRIWFCALTRPRQEFLLHPHVIDYDAGRTSTDNSSLY